MKPTAKDLVKATSVNLDHISRMVYEEPARSQIAINIVTLPSSLTSFAEITDCTKNEARNSGLFLSTALGQDKAICLHVGDFFFFF